MKSHFPGQAALARIEGKVSFVACEIRDNLPIEKAECALRGGLHRINIANVLVPMVSIVLRFTVGDTARFYWAWVNELEENVIESLAIQPELPIIFTDPTGIFFAQFILPNGVREMAQKHLGIISRFAAESPWRPRHFAAARVFVEYDHPTAEMEWSVLDASAQRP